MRFACLAPVVSVCLLTVFFGSMEAAAGDRKFTFLYEATTHPVGVMEYEQFVTWRTGRASDPAYDRFDFRHEIEIGITDHVQIGLYLADWRYKDGATVSNNGAEYRDSGLEVIWNLADPTLDPVGTALYGEVQVGPEKIELEGKYIIQKNIGRWTLLCNLSLEGEWEGESYDDDSGAFELAVGASYQVIPSLTLGMECLNEIAFPDFSSQEDSVLYAGPNASIRTDDWWFTITPLMQVTDDVDADDFQLRLIFGIDF